MAMDEDSGDTGRPRTETDALSLAIMIADDTATNRFLIAAMLQQLGHRVTCVENGAEAVAQWHRVRPDAILMDVEMPVLDGIAATRMIRQREKPGSRTPIIALTAHTGEGERDKLLAAGFDGYVVKPVRMGDLTAELRRCRG